MKRSDSKGGGEGGPRTPERHHKHLVHSGLWRIKPVTGQLWPSHKSLWVDTVPRILDPRKSP